jgi:hypothetical protein
MSAGRFTFGAAAIALCLLAASGHAQTDAAAAETLFQEGRALMKKKDYAEACPKFASSQRLDPGLGTLLNLADCYEKNGQTASAWARFTEAANDAARSGDRKREKVARERAEKLAETLTKLTIAVPPEAQVTGLRVKRGDVLIDRAEWGVAIPVDPGNYKVEATAPFRQPWSSEVAATEPGATVTVTIEKLAEVSQASAPGPGGGEASEEDAAGEPAAKAGGSRTLGLVLVGVGVVGVGVGTWFGLTAKSRWDEAQERCPDRSRCDAQGSELSREAKSAATVSTIAFIVGGAATVGGLVLWLGGSKSSSETRVGIAPAPAGAALVGAF